MKNTCVKYVDAMGLAVFLKSLSLILVGSIIVSISGSV